MYYDDGHGRKLQCDMSILICVVYIMYEHRKSNNVKGHVTGTVYCHHTHMMVTYALRSTKEVQASRVG